MNLDPTITALRFNGRINAGDLEGLLGMMTDDHVFTDTAGDVLCGKAACRRAWGDIFAWWPDYRNIFNKIVTRGSTVIMRGHSVCSDILLCTLSWVAETECGRVRSRHIWPDTPENRRELGI